MFKKTSKIILCFVTAFALLFSFTPNCYALDAGDVLNFASNPFGYLSGSAMGAAADATGGAIVSAIGVVIVTGAIGFMTFCYQIFSWVTSPNFIKVPVISNPFVQDVGLGVTLPFANIIIFIALIAIGLGTALKLGNYDVRKNILKLISVALLINFVPIFCGVAIDISNIIMNFFMRGENSSFNTLAANFSGMIGTYVNLWKTSGSSITVNLFISTVTMVIYNVMLGIAFLLFAVLFLQRYLALWILVIMSPLAFAASILPYTQNWWKQWLSQFTNWCFIGVAAGFFLYLSQQMIGLVGGEGLISAAGPDANNTGPMEASLIYLVPIFLMYYGFFKCMDGSAGGSGAVVNFAQGQTRKLGTWSRRKFLTEPVKDVGKGVVKSRAMGVVTDKVAGVSGPTWGEGQKGFKGWMKRVAAGTVGTATGLNALGAAGTAAAIKRDELVDEAGKKVEKTNARELAKAIHDAGIGTAGFANSTDQGMIMTKALIDKDEGKNKVAKEELKSMDLEQIKTMVESLLKEGKSKEADAIGRIALIMGKAKNTEELGFKAAPATDKEKKEAGWKAKWGDSQSNRLMDAIDVDTIKKYGGDISESAEMMESAAKMWGANKVKAASTEFEDSFIEKYCEAADNVGLEKMVEINPGAVMFRASSSAQDSGFTPIKDKDGNFPDAKKIQEIRRGIKQTAQNAPPDIEIDDYVSPETARIDKELSGKETQSNLRNRQKILERTVEETIKKYNKPKGTDSGPERSDKRPPGT